MIEKIIFGFVFASFSTAAFAENPRQDSIVAHERLSKIHKNAAACLKSGKPMPECQQAMLDECKKEELLMCHTMDEAELQRHIKTHEQELGGTAASERKSKGLPSSP